MVVSRDSYPIPVSHAIIELFSYEGIVKWLQRSEPFDYKMWALIRAIKAHSRTVQGLGPKVVVK